MMKYVFLLALVGVIGYASVQEREPEFDFSQATPAERTVFLQEQADRVRSQLNGGLRGQYGVIRDFSVGAVRLSRGGYISEIVFNDRPPGGSFGKKFENQLSETLCRSYVKTSTAKNKVSISIVLIDQKKSSVGKVLLSVAACRALKIT